jgi:protein phosphatase
MGGYAHGGLASQLALDALYEAVTQNHAASAQKALRRGIDLANLRVYKTCQQLQAGHMGTTLTAAHIHGERLQIAHVGDSRLYLIRNETASCLTNDHTMVGDLVRMRVLTPDKVRTHVQRSILTRGVGLTLFIKPEFSRCRLEENDCLILCSDGLWSVIEDDEFAGLAFEEPSADRLSKRLVDLALERNSDDNISSVVIFVRRLSENKEARPASFQRSPVRSLRKFIPGPLTRLLGRNHNGRHPAK